MVYLSKRDPNLKLLGNSDRWMIQKALYLCFPPAAFTQMEGCKLAVWLARFNLTYTPSHLKFEHGNADDDGEYNPASTFYELLDLFHETFYNVFLVSIHLKRTSSLSTLCSDTCSRLMTWSHGPKLLEILMIKKGWYSRPVWISY